MADEKLDNETQDDADEIPVTIELRNGNR